VSLTVTESVTVTDGDKSERTLISALHRSVTTVPHDSSVTTATTCSFTKPFCFGFRPRRNLKRNRFTKGTNMLEVLKLSYQLTEALREPVKVLRTKNTDLKTKSPAGSDSLPPVRMIVVVKNRTLEWPVHGRLPKTSGGASLRS